jgi:hypothetical protein
MFKIALIGFVVFPFFAHAYLGPGVGGGVIAATIGVVVAIFAALFGIIWFPLKRFLKKKREKKDNIPNDQL